MRYLLKTTLIASLLCCYACVLGQEEKGLELKLVNHLDSLKIEQSILLDSLEKINKKNKKIEKALSITKDSIRIAMDSLNNILNPPQKIRSVDKSSIEIDFVGKGDVQQSLNSGSDFAANTGVGIVLRKKFDDPKFFMSSLEVDLSINVASTADSIVAEYKDTLISNRREFGSYLLLPMNSKQATSFSMTGYFRESKWMVFKGVGLTDVFSGFKVDVIGSNSVWVTEEQSKTATGILFKAGLFHEFIPREKREEGNTSLYVACSYSWRGVLGDVGFNDDEAEDFRMDVLGSDARQYHGIEFDIGLRMKNMEAKVSIPTLWSSGDEVPGLSKTQFVTSISFIGGFPLKLSK